MKLTGACVWAAVAAATAGISVVGAAPVANLPPCHSTGCEQPPCVIIGCNDVASVTNTYTAVTSTTRTSSIMGNVTSTGTELPEETMLATWTLSTTTKDSRPIATSVAQTFTTALQTTSLLSSPDTTVDPTKWVCTFDTEPIVQYAWDPACLGDSSLGCKADGVHRECRFCGEEPYPSCPVCSFKTVSTVPYVWDSTCLGSASLGCMADGVHRECRFCGEPPYNACPTSTFPPSTSIHLHNPVATSSDPSSYSTTFHAASATVERTRTSSGHPSSSPVVFFLIAAAVSSA